MRDEGYQEADIAKWADVIREKTSGCQEVFVYFKHEESGKGPEFASTLMSKLGLTLGRLLGGCPTVQWERERPIA